jgi:hypothetical protein
MSSEYCAIRCFGRDYAALRDISLVTVILNPDKVIS